MMIVFFEDEMTLKTTFLVWEPMVTSSGLISCVINHNEKLRPSMNSTGIGVLFSTRANFYCHINSLSIKHADVPESRNAQSSIITSFIHLIMIGIKEYGVEFEDRLGPFSLHDASRSSLVVLIEIGHVHYPTRLVVD
jgi:hypothetical protein